eukprot:CAMPEP_0174759218 /NCGR_PEP_ID=MMETSP1094-20130205/108158_1 /TAXON_ID=156173 /ORGANISM="Chrysochromulina brevifilum, Strain UTEX LB 985" /LENGTH=144 /DNA_ID=CAMNT_0015965151 /DNA_START=84 /DNA_END=518 /DNA_ORIENTATION=-
MVRTLRGSLIHQCPESGGSFLTAGGEAWMEHLACFVPGMLALGVLSGVSDAPADDTNAAVSLATGCYAMYTSTPTGLAPDAWRFKRDKGDCTPTATGSKFSLRPETIESLFYLWRLTKNETYREWGWNIFNALELKVLSAPGDD